jgi:calcium channel MID1
MQLPKLTPLQSRFLASFVASAVLVVLYLTLTSPQFAYAVDLDSRIPPDHNHPIVLESDFQVEEHEADLEDDERNAESLYGIVSRATEAIVQGLENNSPQNLNIDIGETQNWVFSISDIKPGIPGTRLPYDNATDVEQVRARDELRKRQEEKQIYITANTCLQPIASSEAGNSGNIIPDQLIMYVSTNTSNKNPGPSVSDPQQRVVKFSGGYALATLNTSNDVYVGISASDRTGFTGGWNYEIAASVDAPYHSTNATWPNLFFVDSDNHAALLITNDTTQANSSSPVYQEWMSMKPPYEVFAHNMNDSSILGVESSYCGLLNLAHIVADVDTQNQNVAGMTNRGLGGKPKEQFYINNLKATSKYWGFLAMAHSSTPGVIGGGGKVWKAMNFTTKTGKPAAFPAHVWLKQNSHTIAESNCALMYNLSFCSEVAYAVPSNPDKFSPTTGLPDLAATYDKNAADWYQVFNYSLQQIPCNTTSSAQYSLARNCDDCARAYKQWLCAVTIPRCDDFSSTAPWLMPRNTAQNFVNGSSMTFSASIPSGSGPGGEMVLDSATLLNLVATNSSRNPLIDQTIQPGPYKEVLPCEDLCYDLVQSCPATLGFGCPISGKGLELSYGRRSNDSGIITCSYLGAAYYLSGSGRQKVLEIGWMALTAFIVGALLSL